MAAGFTAIVDASHPAIRGQRYESMHVVMLLAILALTLFTFTKHRIHHNVFSRFLTVQRLVDDGTMELLPESTIDAVHVDGHIYSSKPPNYTLILAAEAYIAKLVTGTRVSHALRGYLWFLIFVSQVLPYTLLLLASAAFLKTHVASAWTRAYAMAALSFACLPFGYAVTLNNHTPTAVVLGIALLWLISVRDTGAASVGKAFSLGFLCGLAFTFELTSGVFAAGFTGLVCLQHRRLAPWAVLGLALPVIPTVATYYAVSGSPLPFYAQRDLYMQPGNYWLHPYGVDAMHQSKWMYIVHCLLGLRGLLSLTPIVVFGFVGAAQTIRDRGQYWREMVVVGAGTIIVVVYILATTDNYGGSAMGVRWFAQFMPLLVFASLPLMQKLSRRRAGRVLAYVLLAISCDIVVESLIQSAFKSGGWVLGLTKVLGS